MERRQFTRYLAQDDAYAVLGGDFAKVGKVCDISLNGLAFTSPAEKISHDTFTHVDIFLSNNGFHLPDVPCNIVYDVKEHTSGSMEISPYRCGLSFNVLQEEQQNKLEFFINNYTTGKI